MSSSSLDAEQPALVIARDAQLLCESTATSTFTNILTFPTSVLRVIFHPSARIYFEEGFHLILSIVLVVFQLLHQRDRSPPILIFSLCLLLFLMLRLGIFTSPHAPHVLLTLDR